MKGLPTGLLTLVPRGTIAPIQPPRQPELKERRSLIFQTKPVSGTDSKGSVPHESRPCHLPDLSEQMKRVRVNLPDSNQMLRLL